MMQSNIKCPLAYNALQCGEETAVIYRNHAITYDLLNNAVWATVTNLKALGVQKNDRVAIYDDNSLELLIVMYALWRLGAVSFLLHTKLPEKKIQEHIETTQSRYLLSKLTEHLVSDVIHQVFKFELKKVVGLHVEGYDKQEGLEIDAGQPATIVQTSGSSGDPKLALHSYGNHYYSAIGSNEHIPYQKGDRWLLTLPFFHVSGLSVLFRTFLAQATIVIPEDDDDIVGAIKKYKITHVSMVQTQFQLYLDIFRKQYSEAYRGKKEEKFWKDYTVKAILLGGSFISRALVEQAVTVHLPIYISYGMTEMSSQIATSVLLTQKENIPKAKVLNHRVVKINDDHNILVSGDVLFLGYVKGDQIEKPFDTSGYFVTGDVGRWLDDDCLDVTGRIDYMFISGGENIQPEEIEKILINMKNIESALVVPVKDDTFGMRPVVFIKPVADRKLNKTFVLKTLSESLPKYKVPVAFYAWSLRLKDGASSLNRKFLKELCENNPTKLKSIF